MTGGEHRPSGGGGGSPGSRAARSRIAAALGSLGPLLGCCAVLGCAAGLLGSRAAHAQAAGEWGSSEQLWRETCRYCHDSHLARELRGEGLAPQAIVTAVRTGPNAMPSFLPSEISDPELEQLAEWISMQKPPAQQSIDQSSRRSRHGSRQRSR